LLDGEAVVLDERGMPDMARLRSSLAGGRGERFVCFAFDILHLDGFDLRGWRGSSASGATHPIARGGARRG
jgi:bifunctional non-homologous end joining protein LigD